MTFLLILALLLPQPTPIVTWSSPSHISVFWPQEVSGERCISKETPGGAVYDYGCFWFFGEVGGGGRMTLPFGAAAPDAFPSPGDIIVVNGARVIVGPHLAYLPAVASLPRCHHWLPSRVPHCHQHAVAQPAQAHGLQL